MAESELSEGKYQQASESLRKVIILNPESPLAMKAMVQLGGAFETYIKDYASAVLHYQEALRLSQDPGSVYEIQKKIAHIYFENSVDMEKAISAYRKLISLNPQGLEVDLFQFRTAEAFFKQSNFEQARSEYQQLVEKFPKSSFVEKSRFQIGNTYYMEGKYDVAIDAFHQFQRYHPSGEYAMESQFLLAQCFEQTGKLTEALRTYEALKTRYTNPQMVQFRWEQLRKRVKKEEQ